MLAGWRDGLGVLSVALAVLAAVIYIVQTLRGEVRPHPLSWFLFGMLSLTGYWVQRDQGARQGSWTLLAMTLICFLFVAVSVARGERSFSRAEWAFVGAGGAVFALYMFTRDANAAAAMTTAIDALGYGPIHTRLVLPKKRQRHEFRDQRGEIRSLADGDGPDLVRNGVLPGDAARSQHGGRDHAAHAQARGCSRALGQNSISSTGVDPEQTTMIGLVNGREARESGLRLEVAVGHGSSRSSIVVPAGSSISSSVRYQPAEDT